MCVAFRYMVCGYVRLLFVCDVVYEVCFVARLVGRGRFVLLVGFVF